MPNRERLINIDVGQRVWVSSITFTRSCSVKRMLYPRQAVVVNLMGGRSYTSATVRFLDDEVNRLEWVNTLEDNICYSMDDAISMFNDQIDEAILGVKQSSHFNGQQLERMFNDIHGLNFSKIPDKYEASEIFNQVDGGGKWVKSPEAKEKNGYVLIYRTVSGMNMISGLFKVNLGSLPNCNEYINICYYFGTNWVKHSDIGTTPLTSIYKTKEDLLIDVMNNRDILAKYIVDKRDAVERKLLKKKIKRV